MLDGIYVYAYTRCHNTPLVSQGGLGYISLKSWVGRFPTLVDRQVAVGAIPVIFVALPVDGFYRTTAVSGFLGVSIGQVPVGTAGSLGVAGPTGAVAGAAGIGLPGNNLSEDSGIAGATSVLVSMFGLTASG